jgi:hypothetical protein
MLAGEHTAGVMQAQPVEPYQSNRGRRGASIAYSLSPRGCLTELLVVVEQAEDVLFRESFAAAEEIEFYGEG